MTTSTTKRQRTAVPAEPPTQVTEPEESPVLALPLETAVPETETAVPAEPPTQVTEPEPNEFVWALLEGADTAILGTQAVFRGEAHKVTFSVVKTAAAARSGVWQYKLEGDNTYRAL